MGSDRARITYDEKRQYRRVVHQQGRVILEADLNEAQAILTEETRQEAFDVVGPAGVPSPLKGATAGFTIAAAKSKKPFDFSVTPGVIYVGGLRVELDAATDWSDQPDHVYHGDLPETREHEFIYLELEEREISALEDQTLREVALGGPDTAQRTRLIRRIRRLGVTANNCADALATAKTKWEKEGSVYIDHTKALRSRSKLLASVVASGAPPNPCEPAEVTGYLGDENQLLRVQLWWDPAHEDQKKLLWAYDGGSALYKGKAASKTRLELTPAPVDAQHRPKVGQYAEVLVRDVRLGPGPSPNQDPSADATNFAAAAVGLVFAITGEDPVSGSIELDQALPDEYPDNVNVFVRIWENQQALVLDTDTELQEHGGQGLGIQVKISLDAPNAAFRRGDYWTFALRPSQPHVIEPYRLAESPQRPDGPRRWAVPLGHATWSAAGELAVPVPKCVPDFDNLVELTARVDDLYRHKGAGCCTFSLTPADVKGDLQGSIEHCLSLAKSSEIRICLGAGRYDLKTPLHLLDESDKTKAKKYTGISLHGERGTVLHVAKGADRAFADGMIVLGNTRNVTIEGLDLRLPHAEVTHRATGAGGDELTFHVLASIGVRALDCAGLVLKNCVFRHIAPEEDVDVRLFGAGLFASGGLERVRVEGCEFVAPAPPATASKAPASRCYGYLHVSSTVLGRASVDVMKPVLEDAIISDNVFERLTTAVLVNADIAYFRLEKNVVRGTHAGFWIEGSAFLNSKGNVVATETGDSPVASGLALGRSYPRPKGFTPSESTKHKLNTGSDASDDTASLAIKNSDVGDVLRGVSRDTPRDAAAALTDNTEASGQVDFVENFNRVLNAAEAPIRAQAKSSELSLHVAGNEIGAPGGSFGSGAALFVAVRSDENDDKSSLIVTANHMRNSSANHECTNVMNVRHVVISGNVVSNAADATKDNKPVALAVQGKRVLCAVTGNLVHGDTVLPQ